MNNNLSVKVDVEINSNVSKVWDALISPVLIKQYLYGADVVSEWTVGSEVVFLRVKEGKEYCDKGKIEKVEPLKLLQYTYWSAFSGLEDLPQNYSIVTFELNKKTTTTSLVVSQIGFVNEDVREYCEISWSRVLQRIKELVEDGSLA